MAKYKASIDPRFLMKVDRIFDAAPQTVWNELLQNARRAGSTEVRIRIDDLKPDDNGFRVIFKDNGHGVGTPEPLLCLAAEGWGGKIEEFEDPAGMGFFCLSNFESVTVRSCGWAATFTPEVFQGIAELDVADDLPVITGTTIRWNWTGKGRQELVGPLREAALYCGIERVILERDPDQLNSADHEVLEVKGFLDDCVQQRYIPEVGYGIGIITHHPDGRRVSDYGSPLIELNFMGVRLDLRDYHDPGLKHISAISGVALNVRVDVRSTSQLRLVLPARNALKHNEARAAMIQDVERDILAYIAANNKGKHVLPYKVYKRAKEVFGIDIGEAKENLKRWSSTWCGDDDGIKNAAIVSADLAHRDQLRILWHRARHVSGKHDLVACLEKDGTMKGYTWYDGLPRITDVMVEINGELHDMESAFDSDQSDQRVAAGMGGRDLFQLVDAIQVIFKLSKGGEDLDDIVMQPEALVRGDSTESCWDSVDPEECWFQVLKECAEDRAMLSAASDLIASTVFRANTDGDDPPSNEQQERDFETALWRELLGLIDEEMEGVHYELERSLDSIPYSIRGADYMWGVLFNGIEDGRAANLKIGYLTTREQYETNCNVLVTRLPESGNDGEIIHVVSQTPVTTERMEHYFDMETEQGYGPDDELTIAPAGPIVDLDAWEKSRGIQ